MVQYSAEKVNDHFVLNGFLVRFLQFYIFIFVIYDSDYNLQFMGATIYFYASVRNSF